MESKTILIVDDDPDLLSLLSAKAKSRYQQVLSAGSAELALAMLRKHRVDLVLTDYEMPQVNGLQLLSRARDAGITCPIILMTGSIHFSSDEAFGLGFSDFLAKPFNAQTLLEILESNLSRSSDVQPAARVLHESN